MQQQILMSGSVRKRVMALGPTGIKEGKKYRKEHEEKKERSRGKRGKHRKALRKRNLQKCKLHFGTLLNRWYVPRH